MPRLHLHLPPKGRIVRILTVRQPWAWAIIHGQKDVENRVRNVAGDYRGPVAIHAGLSPNPGPWWAAIDPPFGSTPHDDHENWGAIIGVVDLADVHHACGCPTSNDDHWPVCSPWAETGDLFHLALSNPRALDEPIPYKGALGLRRLDDVTIARIEAQL